MKAVKHFVFIVFIVLFFSPNKLLTQVYWIQKQSPVTACLYKCVFTDTLNGWACGESGTIIHTSDGGDNWIQQTTNVDFPLDDICFVNSRLGRSIGFDFMHFRNIIFTTTNGGANWNLYPYPDTTVILNTIYFLDSLNGYMGGALGIILKTSDAGNIWKRMDVDSSFYFTRPIKSFKFFDSRIGIACGGANEWGGVLWKTTNYGYNWVAFLIAPEPIYDVVYLDSANAIATGGDPELGASFNSTKNNWVDFDYVLLGFWGIGQAIAMRTQNEIWIPLGFSHSWTVSTDGGQQWQLIMNNDSDAVYDAQFVDSTHGWAVGCFGRVYKFNEEIIGINNHPENTPSAFKLYQNYPNPFNPVTKIKFQTPLSAPEGGKQDVSLRIYNVLGKEMAIIFSSPCGRIGGATYEIDWDGTNYPSGIYFYRLLSGSYSESKKMVLIK